MRLEGIQIQSYGQFNQAQFGPFSNRLSVIHGPNEAGKSTIHAFIRAMLFGFPQNAGQVAAPRRHGGRLILRGADNQRYVIERYLDTEVAITTPDGDPAGPDVLPGLLANVSADLYQSVFAFSIDDLQSIESLPDEAVSGCMYAAGLGIERLPETTARFRRQAAEIFQPGGRIQPVARLLRELSAIEQELAAARRTAEGYHLLQRRRAELDLDIQRAELQLAEIGRIEQRIADDERRIARAGERLKLAESRLAEFERAVTSGDAPASRRPAELRRAIVELRESWTRLQATRRMIDVYQETVIRQRIPRSPWFLVMLMIGILFPVVLGAITGQSVVIGIGIASAALGMITLVMAAIARSRFETAQLQARLHLEMTHREAEGRFLHTAMATGIDPDNADREIERLERERAAMEDAPAAGLSDHDRELLLDERRKTVTEAGEAVDELTGELAAAQAEWQEIAARFNLADELRNSPTHARNLVEERRDALLIEHGRLDGEIQQLESDNRGSVLRARRQEHLTRLRDLTREWATNMIADRLLHDAIRAFEESQQPQVLREASNAFDAMTAGAYHQLLVPDGAEEIIALGRDGREVTVMEMSRGTREQAYLALRIGLIRAFGQRVRALPVLVDDILVNFDPERATEAMRALDGLASDHQVFIFTCHPSTVALARFISPGARIISLGEQKVTNLTPIWLDND